MPTWGELLKELKGLQERHEANPQAFGSQSPTDLLRRKYLKALSESTNRATIVYATAWFENKDENRTQISLSDMQGFMEAVSNVPERELDLILHSPGGSAEAAESIVEYLRTRFDHIRVIVPVAAMSAATMVALGADEIIMGAHSQLGPIDPQFTIFTPEGPRSAPAQAIKDQFDNAKEECKSDPGVIAAWLPILRSYGPGLIAQCDHQRELAEGLVAEWLAKYMLRTESDPPAAAAAAARWFSDFTAFKSHGRRVSRDDARAQGIHVIDLEADDAFQDAVLSVHHAVAHTLSGTPTVKLIENHLGRAYIQMQQIQQVRLAPPGARPAAPGLPRQPPSPSPPLNRAQRRSGRKRKR